MKICRLKISVILCLVAFATINTAIAQSDALDALEEMYDIKAERKLEEKKRKTEKVKLGKQALELEIARQALQIEKQKLEEQLKQIQAGQANTAQVPATGSLKATEIFKRAKEAVVIILGEDGNKSWSGTGFAVTKDGYIITNRHVASASNTTQPAKKLFITHPDWSSPKAYVADVVMISHNRDLALLKINRTFAAPLALATTEAVTGEKVYALGNPGSGSRKIEDGILALTFTEGMINNSNRTIGGNPCLQMTATINGGNSGGPLLNDKCQVVGINTFGLNELENTFFAVKVAEAQSAFRNRLSSSVTTVANRRYAVNHNAAIATKSSQWVYMGMNKQVDIYSKTEHKKHFSFVSFRVANRSNKKVTIHLKDKKYTVGSKLDVSHKAATITLEANREHTFIYDIVTGKVKKIDVQIQVD